MQGGDRMAREIACNHCIKSVQKLSASSSILMKFFSLLLVSIKSSEALDTYTTILKNMQRHRSHVLLAYTRYMYDEGPLINYNE